MGTGTAGKHRKKNTKRIRRGRKTYTDRWHDRHESIIDICGYCKYHRITEKYKSACGTIVTSEPNSKSVNDRATKIVWRKHVLFSFSIILKCFD